MKNTQPMEIPKEFWKYYDLFRRGKIDIEEFSKQSELAIEDLARYLSYI